MLSPDQRTRFLTSTEWAGANIVNIGEDWSQRKILRVIKGDGKSSRTAILMHTVPDNDPRATPGHHLSDYVRIAEYLRSLGFSVPVIYAQNLAEGMILVEDFGTDTFHDILGHHKELEEDLYIHATNVLIKLYQDTAHVPISLPDYYAGHVHTARRRVVDWYMPAVTGHKNSPRLVQEFLDIWHGIEKKLPPVMTRFLHTDFHPGNLMWLPTRSGVQQVGILDFQGAYIGPAPYDLVNLLDDARRIVPHPIKTHCLERFMGAMAPDVRESFAAWYPVLACQFHGRVIGQAIRLAIRDNKTRLMALIPVLQHHMHDDLTHPLLAPLKQWFDANGVDFSQPHPIDLAATSPLIGEDAF